MPLSVIRFPLISRPVSREGVSRYPQTTREADGEGVFLLSAALNTINRCPLISMPVSRESVSRHPQRTRKTKGEGDFLLSATLKAIIRYQLP